MIGAGFAAERCDSLAAAIEERYAADGVTCEYRGFDSIEDLRAALEREPRHFGALQGFAALLEEMGRPEAAREVWGRVLALTPHDSEALAAAQRLDIMLGGRTL